MQISLIRVSWVKLHYVSVMKWSNSFFSVFQHINISNKNLETSEMFLEADVIADVHLHIVITWRFDQEWVILKN